MVYLEPALLATLAADVLGQAPDATLALTRPVFDDVPLRAAFVRLFDHLEACSAAPDRVRDAASLACEESLVETVGQLLERHATANVGTHTSARAGTGTAAAQQAARQAPHDRLAERARERLADAFDSTAPTLAELARLTDLSRYQLLRRYTAAYGVPPHAWLLQRRAERARTLIRNGSALADAAAACGFADQSPLTRVFTRHFGYTPGAWRAAISFKTAR